MLVIIPHSIIYHVLKYVTWLFFLIKNQNKISKLIDFKIE